MPGLDAGVFQARRTGHLQYSIRPQNTLGMNDIDETHGVFLRASQRHGCHDVAASPIATEIFPRFLLRPVRQSVGTAEAQLGSLFPADVPPRERGAIEVRGHGTGGRGESWVPR